MWCTECKHMLFLVISNLCLKQKALKFHGETSSFEVLTDVMRAKSHVTDGKHGEVTLNLKLLKRWWKQWEENKVNKAKTIVRWPTKRVQWSQNFLTWSKEKDFNFVCLDEQWFYMCSAQNPPKCLPKQYFDEDGANKLLLRKFPIAIPQSRFCSCLQYAYLDQSTSQW